MEETQQGSIISPHGRAPARVYHLPTWKRLSFTYMTDNELEPSRLIQMTNLAALEFWWIPWPIAWASLKCEQMSQSLVGAHQWCQYSPSMALAGLLLKIDMVKVTFWMVTSPAFFPILQTLSETPRSSENTGDIKNHFFMEVAGCDSVKACSMA